MKTKALIAEQFQLPGTITLDSAALVERDEIIARSRAVLPGVIGSRAQADAIGELARDISTKIKEVHETGLELRRPLRQKADEITTVETDYCNPLEVEKKRIEDAITEFKDNEKKRIAAETSAREAEIARRESEVRAAEKRAAAERQRVLDEIERNKAEAAREIERMRAAEAARIEKARADAAAEQARLQEVERLRIEKAEAKAREADQKIQSEAQLNRRVEAEQKRMAEAAERQRLAEEAARENERRLASESAERIRLAEEAAAESQRKLDEQAQERQMEMIADSTRLKVEAENAKRMAIMTPIPEAHKVAGAASRREPKYRVTDLALLYASCPIVCKLEEKPSAIRAVCVPRPDATAEKPDTRTPGLEVWWENATSIRSR